MAQHDPTRDTRRKPRRTPPSRGAVSLRCGALLALAVASAGSASACTGNIGDPPGGVSGVNPGPGPDPSFQPPAASLRRLLGRQYRNAIQDLLGEQAAIVADPPADSSLNGFDAIAAAQLALGDAQVIRYESSARAVATAAMGDQPRIDALLGCTPTGADDAACHGQLVARFGRLLWRRSLEQIEIDTYVGVAQEASLEFGDFYAGVEFTIAALLQSPNFLYQVEIGQPSAADPSRYELTGAEVAARMSFFLLDTTPSDALLLAAEQGQLSTDEGVRAVARGILEQPQARAALGNFYSEVFKLRELDGLVKDSDLYPQFTPTLAQAMREETLRLIEDVVWERDGDFRDIFDAPYTFANAELAELYGVEGPAEGWGKIDLPTEHGRAGVFGQAGFLSVFGHVATTSPTLRGRFIRETILCQSIPAPPNNVVTEFPPDVEAKTMREKLIQHQNDPSCAGCHRLMDTIGLGLENFDSIGEYRTLDNGAPIDAVSTIEGIGTFEGAGELGALMREQPEVASCIVRNVFRGATGHVETTGEKAEIEELEAAFTGSGFRLQDLLVELVSSPAFRLVGRPE